MSERPVEFWTVLSDQLTSEGHPLGEYVALALKYEKQKPPDSKHRRMRTLAREFEARFPTRTMKFDLWSRWGLRVHFKEVRAVLANAEELSRTRMPLFIDVGDGTRSTQECVFDAKFEHLAWMEGTYSVTNQNHSPGMDEEYHHWRDVKVWRVADRELVLELGRGERWDRLEFREDGLYAIESGRAVLLRT